MITILKVIAISMNDKQRVYEEVTDLVIEENTTSFITPEFKKGVLLANYAHKQIRVIEE